MMSSEDQLLDVSIKIRNAHLGDNIPALAVLEPMMDRLLDAKHNQMVGR